MINAINSVQNVEPRNQTVAKSRSESSEEDAKVYDLKQAEKERTDELQGKTVKESEQEPKEKEEITQDMLDELAKDIEILHRIGLNFAQHEDSGRTMVSVMNRDTDELIRQIPAEDVLDMAVKMEEMIGLLFDEKV